MNMMPGLPIPPNGDQRNSSRRKLYRAKPGGWVQRPSRHREPAAAPAPALAEPRFLTVGDMGLSIQFGTEITQDANEAVAALDHAITAADIPGILETVPSFRSLLVVFEPVSVDRASLILRLRALLAATPGRVQLPQRHWSVPVTYRPFGEDLAEVSAALQLSEQDVVAAHTAAEFRVCMLGFQPGLPNLGGLPPRLHISRRTTPRAPVPGGSVMIGGDPRRNHADAHAHRLLHARPHADPPVRPPAPGTRPVPRRRLPSASAKSAPTSSPRSSNPSCPATSTLASSCEPAGPC